MGRYDRRIQRLERQVRGRPSTPWQATLARMSYEELQAEIASMAVRFGHPGNPDGVDMAAALQWLHEQVLVVLADLPKEEQSAWRAELKDLAALAASPW